MVFSSITFLLAFLPVMLAVYYLMPRRLRNYFLFLASLVFYAWGEPIYVLLMIVSTVADYSFARYAHKWNERGDRKKARRAVYATVIFNLGMLGFFKYTDFILGTINGAFGMHLPLLHLPLPIGISFYSFQTMSYTIDVYRQAAKPQKNPLDLGAYVALFPQLIAGPIVRYSTVAEQLNHRRENLDQFSEGVCRFVVGLGKKVLIANQVGLIFSELSAAPVSELSVLGAWLGAIAFTLQIYFDFSGYSDMAIGLGKMLGFDFLENFRYPYIAKSITDFWRRWHISLSSWFRDYVYIPLGGSRCGALKQYRNLFVVWLLTGIWHGANWNFVIWGLYYAILLMIEKAFLGRFIQKTPAAVQHIYTMFLVIIGWIIFSIEDLSVMGSWLRAMFGFGGVAFTSVKAMHYLLDSGVWLIIGVLAAIPWWKSVQNRLVDRPVGSRIMSIGQPVLLVLLLLFSMAFLVSSTYNPFLYFRF